LLESDCFLKNDFAQPNPAITVWVFDLIKALNFRTALFEVLSADEAERMMRFKFEADQNRYLAGRGGLRLLLGACLDCPASQLEFACTKFGKPSLQNPGSFSGDFSVSHSHERILIAISPSVGHVGVDVEQHRSRIDWLELADRFFSEDETIHIRSLPKEAGFHEFFKTWTLKESLIKAMGGGLSIALTSFSVSTEETFSNQLRRLELDGHRLEDWAAKSLDLGEPDYSAAISWKGAGSVVVQNGIHFLASR